MGADYVGAAWRSRFLRAPKFAFDLAARRDFVPLGVLATVRLGLKTGCDKFFYVTRVKGSSGITSVDGVRCVQVSGLKGEWTGFLALRDLLPAVLNPHGLQASGQRLFGIPAHSDTWYVHPKRGQLRAQMKDYIESAERIGVNRMNLVRENADPKRWFLQVRGVVASPWALPYNSAYGYGAFENGGRAVLNGRFVGVEPRPYVDSDVLGAVLTSTFVAVTRLLEGTATGVEGAYDVGPPAARKMLVPDFTRMESVPIRRLQGLLDEIRRGKTAPPPPSAQGSVVPVRNELDIAILEGLGCSRGEASSICGRLYESYARWRASIEVVEAKMRSNRREMSRQGRTRAIKPAEMLARTVWADFDPEFPGIPHDFLSPRDDTPAGSR